MARKETPAAAFLAALPLFKALDAAALTRLAAGTTRRLLKRGETLFRKGEDATGMYVVAYGEIKLMSSTSARGSRLSGIVGPGQSFGEPVMFLERPTLVEAQAGSDTLVLQVPKEAVFAELERSPKFARRMIAGLSQRIEKLVYEADRQALGSGSERFVAYLLRQGRSEKAHGGDAAGDQGGGRIAAEPDARALLAHPARPRRRRTAAGDRTQDHGAGPASARSRGRQRLRPARVMRQRATAPRRSGRRCRPSRAGASRRTESAQRRPRIFR